MDVKLGTNKVPDRYALFGDKIICMFGFCAWGAELISVTSEMVVNGLVSREKVVESRRK